MSKRITLQKNARTAKLAGKEREVHSYRLIRKADVSVDDLVTHIMLEYGIEEPITHRVTKAIGESVTRFVSEGRGVHIPYLGMVTPALEASAAKTQEELTPEMVRGIRMRFYPLASIKRELKKLAKFRFLR